MKLFITGGYSCGNAGDEAILKSTIYGLKNLFPSASFTIWTSVSDFKIKFDRPISYEIIFWKPLPWINQNNLASRILTKLYTDGYPFSEWIAKGFHRFAYRVRKALRESDKVVFVGGGYINSDFCLLEMSTLVALASALDKPIYLLGQTLGPFKKPQHRSMAKEIFQSAEQIVLRDSESAREVTGFSGKVWQGVDDALGFHPKLSIRDRTAVDCALACEPDTFLVGLSLRNWAGGRQRYQEIAAAIESFVQTSQKNWKIVFIPMETSSYCNDLDEGKEFAKYLSPDTEYGLMEVPLSVEQKFYLISRLDLLVGMRLHSLVFALSNGVPAIGLYDGEYYFRKIAGLFGYFEVKQNILSLDQLEELVPLIRSTVSNKKPIRDLLTKRQSTIERDQQSLLETVMA